MVRFSLQVQPDPDDDEHKYPAEYMMSGDIARLIKECKPWEWVVPDQSKPADQSNSDGSDSSS